MKTFVLNITATILVPDEAVENESGRGWTLTDGTIIKPFVVLEKDEMDNLTYDQGAELGVFVEDDTINAVTVYDGHEDSCPSHDGFGCRCGEA